jgi:hypothetical protein
MGTAIVARIALEAIGCGRGSVRLGRRSEEAHQQPDI